MTVASFLRVLASGGLLLAATTTTTTLVQPAGASSLTGFTDVCPIEFAACADDVTCVGCNIIGDSSSAEIQACGEGLDVDSNDSSETVCSEVADYLCCVDEASPQECIGNDNFHDVWLCWLDERGCSFDKVTCDGDGNANGSSSDAAVATVGRASIAALSCALLVPFLPVL